MWTLIRGKELGFSCAHIVSLILAIILFVSIILYRQRGLKVNLSYVKVVVLYWFITTALITCGAIIHAFIWLILQNGFSGMAVINLTKLIAIIIIGLMTFSFPGLLIALITIKESGYINNFNRIIISGIILIFIPDIIYFITNDNVQKTNEIFYGVFNDLIGILLLALLLSLIITKLNIIIIKQDKKDKLQIEYYFIVSIVCTLALSLLVYLFFINQFSCNITIKLTDWKGITLRTTKHGLKYETIVPGMKIDLPKYEREGMVYIVNPVGSMQIDSVDYPVESPDIISINQATRISINKSPRTDLIISAVSRSIIFKNRLLPTTIWSTVSPGQKTTIIAGIFLIFASIIGSLTTIYVKIKKKDLQ